MSVWWCGQVADRGWVHFSVCMCSFCEIQLKELLCGSMMMYVIMCGMKWYEQISWTNRFLHRNSDYITQMGNRSFISGLTWNLAILSIVVSTGRYISDQVIYKPRAVIHLNWHCVWLPGEQRPCLSWLCHLLLTAVLGKSNLCFKQTHNRKMIAGQTSRRLNS
jgi:hypothetical protein